MADENFSGKQVKVVIIAVVAGLVFAGGYFGSDWIKKPTIDYATINMLSAIGNIEDSQEIIEASLRLIRERQVAISTYQTVIIQQLTRINTLDLKQDDRLSDIEAGK